MKASYAVLIASMIVALGGWMVTLNEWGQATTTIALGGLLMNLAGVFLAWMGKSPIKPKQ